jgi:hypothetical protein
LPDSDGSVPLDPDASARRIESLPRGNGADERATARVDDRCLLGTKRRRSGRGRHRLWGEEYRVRTLSRCARAQLPTRRTRPEWASAL